MKVVAVLRVSHTRTSLQASVDLVYEVLGVTWLQFMDPYAEEHDAKVLSFGEASKKAASITHTAEL